MADERLGNDLTGAWKGVPSHGSNTWYPMDPVEGAITVNIGMLNCLQPVCSFWHVHAWHLPAREYVNNCLSSSAAAIKCRL